MNVSSEDVQMIIKKSGHKKNSNWTIGQVKYVASAFGYGILDTIYTNQIKKIKMVCPNGHETSLTWGRFINVNQRCKTCYGRTKWNISLVKEKASERGYLVLSDSYSTNLGKLEMMCPEGHLVHITWGSFMFGAGCRLCGIESSRKHKRIDFSEILKDIHNDEYEYVSGNYVDCRTKIVLRCNMGHEYTVSMRDFRAGNRCPKCRRSKGEHQIARYLDSNRISYVRQKKFDECKDKNHLPFDFYLPSLNMCIEYQGEQHYKEVKIWGGKKRLREQIRRDKIKESFSAITGIKLLVIPYWDLGNIDGILHNSIKKEVE